MKNFKKSKFIKIISMMMAVVLTVSSLSAPIEASTSSQIKAEQAQLQQQQNALQEKINSLAADKSKAIEYQKALEEKITSVENRILAINENVRTLDAGIIVAESEIQKASEKYSETINLLQERIKALYMAGELGTLEIVMNAESIADFADRAMFLENMTVYDQALLADLQDYLDETEDVRNELKDQKELVGELKKEVDVQREDLQELETENAAVIAELQNNEEFVASQIAQGEKDLNALGNELAAALKKEEEERLEAEAEKEEADKEENKDESTDKEEDKEDNKEEEKEEEPEEEPEKEPENNGSSISLTWPCPGYTYISSYWGDGRNHQGIDFAAPFGTPIYAASSGTIITANTTNSWGGGWGYYVSIKHSSTWQTLYAHCSSIVVKSGQYVSAGQLIGYVGSTGNSSGNHLHFELYKNGTRIDPWPYLT